MATKKAKQPVAKKKGGSVANPIRFATNLAAKPAAKPAAAPAKPGGFFAKLGGIVKKALPVVAKFAPGPIGTALKLAEGVFNDPEWWQDPMGSGLTTNVPLTTAQTGTSGTDVVAHIRPWMLEINSTGFLSTDARASTYLAQAIRMVTNAVALRTPTEYANAIKGMSQIYCINQHLRKIDYVLKHAQPYLPNVSIDVYPILATGNAAVVQSLIQRTEEIMRSSVRLPTTLTEYLTWRFGRVFRTNTSAKSALVFYSPIPLTSVIADYATYIDDSLTLLSGVAEAKADVFNAYQGHVQVSTVPDNSQMRYDAKEFVLRTNLSGGSEPNNTSDLFIMDSDLPNAETFIASCVSTKVSAVGEVKSLFDVTGINIHFVYGTATNPVMALAASHLANGYWVASVDVAAMAFDTVDNCKRIILRGMFMKGVDLYNNGVIATSFFGVPGLTMLTPVSIDAGVVTDQVIANLQDIAYANLVNPRRNKPSSVATEIPSIVNAVKDLVPALPTAG